MQRTQQTPSQTIAQHGLDVWKTFYDFFYAATPTRPKRWPSWWNRYGRELHAHLHPFKINKHYAIWHDCGKPFCRTVDDQGKQHFPEHAFHSAHLFSSVISTDPILHRLLLNDMAMHTEKADVILQRKWSIEDACTLIGMAWAELHSNAKMFGGIDSNSFKIKFKRWEKTAQKLLHYYFDHKHSIVIVRNDLSFAQKAVQSGHAVIEMTRKLLPKDAPHPSLVFTVVKSEPKLKAMMDEIKGLNYKWVGFQEPDLNHEWTAIATEPLTWKQRQSLKRLQLLSG